MALNTEYNVANLPMLDIRRSRFDKSHGHKTTLNVGELVPIFVDSLLPGTTCTIRTNKLVRLQTLISPIMDNLYLDTYFFAIPLRLVWTHLAEFFGENTQGSWYPSVNYQIPTISTGSKAIINDNDHLSAPFGFPYGSVADYMGVPINSYGFKVNALPFRAYALCWNEYFRDENLSDPVYINKGDGDTDISEWLIKYLNGTLDEDMDYRNYGSIGLKPLKVAKYKDVFTTMLPSPQKGPSVMIPFDLAGIVPVHAFSEDLIDFDRDGINYAMRSHSKPSATTQAVIGANGSLYYNNTSSATGANGGFSPYNLGADFDIESSTVEGGFSVNQLRLSVATQRFLEVSARYGSRLTETIQGHFGVTPADSRLQRPEFIGGSHFPLNIDQVVQQSETSDNSPLGETGAYSVTAHSDEDTIVFSSQEWCLLLGLATCRYEHSYQQGLDPMWTQKNMLDFYFPEFSNIGEVGVEGKTLLYQGENFQSWVDSLTEEERNSNFADKTLEYRDNTIIGYQEAWWFYRTAKNRISGEMHSGISNSLDSWHLADYYDIYNGAPVLGDEWIREDPSVIDRVIAVSESNADQVLLDLYFEYDYVAPMPVYSIPSLTDIRG